MAVQSELVLAELERCVPEAVVFIVRELEERGFETWVVGGAVRDAAFGPPVDWDLATRAVPEEMRTVFRRTIPIGVDHGTVGVIAPGDSRMYEVTTFRRDVETTGRHAVVRFAEHVEDDLSRRDFTFNAMAWHPMRNTLLDPHGGLDDLRQEVLRTVGDPGERFHEDYLRILRALRFAGRLGLSIHPRTWSALVDGTPHLKRLSGERIREEVLKVLAADQPSRALRLYRESGALAVLFPELTGTPSSFQRTLDVIDSLRPHRPLPRLAVLMAAGGVDPERIGAVAARMKALRFSNEEVAGVSALNAASDLPSTSATDADIRRWLSRHDSPRINDLLRIRLAEVRAPQSTNTEVPGFVLRTVRRIRTVMKGRPPLSISDLALDGNDLMRMGMKPGPHFKTLFRALLDDVLEDPHLNQRAHLEARIRELEGLEAP